jgi:hypothetical protein
MCIFGSARVGNPRVAHEPLVAYALIKRNFYVSFFLDLSSLGFSFIWRTEELLDGFQRGCGNFLGKVFVKVIEM